MWYGIDWTGPVSSAGKVDAVSVQTLENALPSYFYDVLCQEIDPVNGDPDQSYTSPLVHLFMHTPININILL